MFDLDPHTQTQIDIRRAVQDDLPGISRVSVDTWRHTYRGLVPGAVLESLRYSRQEDRHRGFLREPKTVHCVAVEPSTQEVVGFCNGGPCRQPALGFDAEIYELYIQNGFQGRQVGRRLFETVRRALQDQGLASLLIWVLASNPNRGFYERLGGRVVSRQPARFGGAAMQEVAFGWDA